MNRPLYQWRRIRNRAFLTLSIASSLFGLGWLALILGLAVVANIIAVWH